MSRSKDAWAYHPEHPYGYARQSQPTTVVGLFANATTRACIFDTETTGLARTDRVIELAAAWVDLATGRVEQDEASRPLVRATLLDPGMPIPAAATKVHGIRDRDVCGKSTLDKVLPGFLRFVGDGPLVAHNASFDMRMLRREAERLGLRLPGRVPVYCTQKLARALLPKETSKALASVAAQCGVEQRKGAHRALADVETTGAVLAALIARAGRDLRELLTEEDRL